MLICQAICKADARGNGVRLETGPGLLGTGVFSYRNVIGLFRKVNHAVVGVTGHVGLLQLYFQGLDFSARAHEYGHEAPVPSDLVSCS